MLFYPFTGRFLLQLSQGGTVTSPVPSLSSYMCIPYCDNYLLHRFYYDNMRLRYNVLEAFWVCGVHKINYIPK